MGYAKVQLIVSAILLISLITSCGKTDRMIASYAGFAKTCIDGVQYLQFTSGASVQYGTDGKVKVCEKP